MKAFLTGGFILIAINILLGQSNPEYFQFKFDKNGTSEDLPLYFDLRDSTFLSDVKTQLNGGCWAAATMATIEARLQKTKHDKIIFSDANLKLCHGFDSLRSSNGNHYMASACFTSGREPQVKSDASDSICCLHPAYYIPEARYLPNEPGIIKEVIMTEGPVFSMMYFKIEFLDTLNYTYFSNQKKINHAVSLVGWNDTLTTRWGKGVWIAQNSLGRKFAEDGFFYIAYQDVNILQYNALWPLIEKANPKQKVYYYDTLGSYYSFGFKDTICSGLTKFIADSDITIKAISTALNHPGTTVNIAIYKNFTGDSTLSDLLYQSNDILCKYFGYYSFKPDKEINIKKGDEFFIMISYQHPVEKKPLPIECFIEGYSNPHLMSDKCWVNPDFNRWPQTWYLCGSASEWSSLKFDLCIKVITEKTR